MPQNPLDFLPNLSETEALDDSAEVAQIAEQLEAQREALRAQSPAAEPKSEEALPPSSANADPAQSASHPQAPESCTAQLVGRSSCEEPQSADPPPPYTPTPADLTQYTHREVIIDSNGVPRQAGADSQEGEFIKQFRSKAERSLFLFLKGVLGRTFLTKTLHKPVCEFLQRVPPFRKLVLMPREHAKTAIVSGGLPLHIIIQPAATNIYLPGLEGSECRILLCGETETMAKKNLRVLEGEHSGNRLLRAFWPHRVWDQPRSQAKEWSATSLIFPRQNEWPDPTIRAVGVGGAITGARPNVMIKDDLISFKAANSDVVMEEAIEWHKASRALLDTYEIEQGIQSLEFLIGTRWAVYDLYSYIIDNDPSVEVIDEAFHRIIHGDRILWPEKHTKESIGELHREHGSMFFLLYLNSVADPELVDFDLEMVREFKVLRGEVRFDEDERDGRLEEKAKAAGREPTARPELRLKRGTRLTPRLLGEMASRREFFRARYG